MEKLDIVLSLFNGMGTGQQALDDLNISYSKFYSSEIKPAAIKLVKSHFPETTQLGDIKNWESWNIDWSRVSLILSGSPCQDLSIAGKQKGITGKKSFLFFVFIDILNHVRKYNPDVLFFQENVAKGVADEDIRIISESLGIYPFRTNSNLVTAQNRDRNYWSNFKTKKVGFFNDIYTDFTHPSVLKTQLSDILENGFTLDKKAQTLLASEAKTFGYKNMDKFKALIIRRLKAKKQNPNLVYSFSDKAKTGALLESEGRNTWKDKNKQVNRCYKHSTHLIIFSLENGTLDVRNLTKIELCRLQGFPDNYCDILTRNQAASLLGDGWTLPMIKHFFKELKR